MKLALPNFRCITKSWQILCRYVCVFKKLNSINPINNNLTFCGAKSSIPFVKFVFMKINFTRGMLDFGSQKLRLLLIGLMEFNFLKTQTYLHKICQLFVIHLKIGGANFMGQSRLKGKNCWKIHYLPEWNLKFYKHGKVSNPD
jgi:hypothetical protein